MTEILKITLEAEGIEVNLALCEHFAYTRQELFQAAKINHITSFEVLIGKYGQCSGCEVCKPVVASILASLWNEPIVEHETLQIRTTAFWRISSAVVPIR